MTKYKTVKFGDVVRQVKDKVDPQTAGLERYVAGEHMDTDNLHIRRWGDVGAGYLGPAFHMRFQPGQILYGSRRTYLRKIAVADFEGITANTTYVIEPKDPEVLLPDFLPFVMSTERFHEHSIKQSKGSVNPYINFSDITWYEFPLPPVDEQRRIADLLWAADDVVQNWETVKQTAIRLLETKLSTTFDLKTSPEDEDWIVTPLNEVASLQTGIAKGKQYGKEIKTVEMSYLSVLNVQDGYLDLANVKKIVLPEKDVERYLLKSGDIVIAEGGDSDKVGRGAIWRGQIAPCLHQNHVFCIRTDKNKISAEFLSFQMRSNYGKTYFLKSAKKTSNLASINSTQVKNFPVLMCSLDFQNKTVEQISQLENAVNQIDEHLSVSINLKRNLLAKLIG